jgi:GDP-4-dehydro-6-deoxy-D-mannose reductase
MRALITGLEGFVGRHLARHLTALGREVWGTTEKSRPAADWPADLPVHTNRCNVDSASDVDTVLSIVKPDEVYHLAGLTHTPESWDEPERALRTNTVGTLNVLDAVRAHVPRCRVLLVSTGDVYGHHVADRGAREDDPTFPSSPYAISKLAADQLGRAYAVHFGLHVLRARPFSHTGPGQRPPFVFPRFARGIARAEAGLEPKILTAGNLSIQRDVSDVRDVVRAYALIVEKGEPGACYNVGRGETVVLDAAVRTLIGMASVPIELRVDPALVRPNEPRAYRCDTSALRARTGWEPSIPFEQTMADLLAFWREQTRAETTT